MVTSVQLGNFFTSNGKTVMGGVGGSGLDTKSLVEGLSAAKRAPAVKIENTIKTNESKSAALGELKTLLSKVKDAANFLRNPPGVNNAADNVFKYTSVTVGSNTGSAGSLYVSATSSPGANLQNYKITEITSLAQAKKQTTGVFNIANTGTSVVSNTPGAGEFKTGAFTLNGKTISLVAGDSLATVASKFNQVSADTGVSANIIQVGSGQYQLAFTATKTGMAANFNLGDPGDATALSVTDATGVLSGIAFDTTQDAANAEFELDGIPIIRQSNAISDVLEGVTLNLLQKTPPGAELDVNIAPDQGIAKNGIVNFVNAYNELKIFAAKQTERATDGSPKETAVLVDDQLMRSTLNGINNELNNIVGGLSGMTRLSDLGIGFADLPESTDNPFTRNILTIDEGKLTSALSTDYNAARKVFEFSFASDNANVTMFSRTNAATVTNFSLNLVFAKPQTQESGVFTLADVNQPAVTAAATPGMFTAGQVQINGVALDLQDGDTLQQVVDKFNDIKAQTGIGASINTIAPGQYSIIFTAQTSGTAGNFDLSGASVSDPDGVLANLSFTTTQASVNASYNASYTGDNGVVTEAVDVTPLSGGGYTISGKSGTGLEGLVMVYGGTTNLTANITMTQGIADRVYNVTEPVMKDNTGSLALALKGLSDNNTRLTEDVKKIDANVEVFRTQLLDKFAALEKAISQVNTLLQSLDAQAQARNNAS